MDPKLEQSIKHDLLRMTQQWIENVFMLGAALYMLFGIVDYFATPENFRTFLVYRATVACAIMVLFMLNRLRQGKWYQFFILLAATVLATVIIERMALSFGGYRSPYYAGINIIIIAALGFIPLDIWLSVVLALVIYGISLVPVLSAEALRDPIFISNNGIMISIFTIVLILRGQSQRLIVNELAVRKELELEKERLKYTAAELNDSIEELKNFTYITSHDLRAPLVNIKGFSQELGLSITKMRSLLQKHADLLEKGDQQQLSDIMDKSIPEAIEFIDSSITRMDSLINGILKLSRIGRTELKPELIHTEELVHDLLKTLAHRIELGRAEVAINSMPDIVIDRTAAEQIFGNLLDNAVKYLDPVRPGSIHISADQNETKTIFTIRDNGRGIAKEDIPKVFELFRRVGKPVVPGEGMGLTYVKALIRRLGGRIWCESELGQGTTFIFTIPRTDRPE